MQSCKLFGTTRLARGFLDTKSWRITSSRELTKFRCAITALGGPTYDTYWYQEDSKYGQWLLEEDMSGPSSLYSDNDNYCTCVSDL